MEIRARFVLIGAFSLLSIVGILYFILWLSSSPTDGAVDEYRIQFDYSVSGLSVGNAVLFSGIRVGQVRAVKLSEVIPGNVEVIIQVRGDTPVRMDSVASLEMIGLTGASAVAITGGTAESPLVPLKPGEVGIIESVRSPLQAVMFDVPNTVESINSVLANLKTMTGQENREALSSILTSFAEVSKTLADSKGDIAGAVREGHLTLQELNTLLRSANNTIANIDAIVTSLAPELRRSSKDTLPQLRALVAETRAMVQMITRIGEKVDSDPRQFFLGNPIKEYELP